ALQTEQTTNRRLALDRAFELRGLHDVQGDGIDVRVPLHGLALFVEILPALEVDIHGTTDDPFLIKFLRFLRKRAEHGGSCETSQNGGANDRGERKRGFHSAIRAVVSHFTNTVTRITQPRCWPVGMQRGGWMR